MAFLGRVRETAEIIRCLSRNENIILSGRYGIGRTSLIRNAAKAVQTDRIFIYVDFSKTPGEMAHKIAAWLMDLKKHGSKAYIPYRKVKSLLNYGSLIDGRRPVIVLDNIASLTGQKISFLQDISFEKRFSFVAITESFLPQQSLFRLRACLFPAQLIKLGYLHRKEVIELFRISAKRHGLNWDDEYIRHLAASMKGYPLSINEMIKRGIENKENADK